MTELSFLVEPFLCVMPGHGVTAILTREHVSFPCSTPVPAHYFSPIDITHNFETGLHSPGLLSSENLGKFVDRISSSPTFCCSPARQRPGVHQKRFSQSHMNSKRERFFHFLRCDTNLLPLALPRQLALKLFRSYSSPSR